MGNDGGSIPTRRELVKNAARPKTVSEVKATKQEAQAHAWKYDPINGKEIDIHDLVSDWRGRIYNYETVLNYLMDEREMEAAKQYRESADDLSSPESDKVGQNMPFGETGIRSVRDVVRLKGHTYTPCGSDLLRWQCPMTMRDIGLGAESIYLVPCGHVFSELAVDKFPEKRCVECSAGFETSDIIPILSTDKDQEDKLRQRIERLRAKGLTHSLKKDKNSTEKKSKKSKRKAEAEADADGEKGEGKSKVGMAVAVGKTNPPAKKRREASNGRAAEANDIFSRINDPMTAALTAKVLAEQEKLQQKRRQTATK
ncbi:Replication termination factor 2 [Sporothrix epigloea]|uniref:Replication termination factor 2 n=1 Tax=Sporothrix epigloea TaxID=1892477 RepID=A0ABP0DC69_9PEZI